ESNAMSFRLFIYYCALCGGWSAFFGWALGRVMAPHDEMRVGEAGVKGMFLGLLVALGLSLVDALWNLSLRQFGQVFLRVVVAVLVGCVGGLLGGMLGQILFNVTGGNSIFLVFGWTLTGLIIGTSIGVFEVLSSVVRQQDVGGARKKLPNGPIAGTPGGVLGGILYLVLVGVWTGIFSGKDRDYLWSPSAMGFVALGMCIGLLIGLAQVILKEAWVRVEQGFRAGREMILSKERTTIGRAESCDIGLFGDNTIEKLHASIVQAGNRYFLEDNQSPTGTYLNDQQVAGRAPLNSGDRIRVGRSVLCFRERQKRNPAGT